MAVLTGTDTPRSLACFGASGNGVQIAIDVRFQAGGATDFIGYVADPPFEPGQVDGGFPIMTIDEVAARPDVAVVVTVFDPAGRRRVFDRLHAAGVPIARTTGLPHLAHPEATIGEGTVITTTTRLGHSTVIGRGCVVLADTVAHDCIVGDFTSIALGVIVSGHVHIGSDVLIGVGALIRHGTAARPLVIGDGAVVGAGAVVDRDVAPGEVIVGPRAMPAAQWRALRDLAADQTS